jgi:uncharacterized protein (DUF924 family)
LAHLSVFSRATTIPSLLGPPSSPIIDGLRGRCGVTRDAEVLEFWFGEPATDEAGIMAKVGRWFRGGPAMDAEVREKFGAVVEAALAGELDDWAASPRGRLALVLVLDQFTRNVFRNDPRTHAGDPKAQDLAVEALDRGMDAELAFVERLFLTMPLVHAEDLALQRRAAAYAQALAPITPPLYAKMAAMHLEQTAKYEGVIARFSRFPHRNALLGRESTPEESAFLADWADRAPPKGAPTG